MDKIGEKIGFIAFFFAVLNISTSAHPVLLILCYIIHEAGHITMAKVNNVGVKALRLGSFRLCISYDCSRCSYKKELAVCCGGILFNLIFALIGWLLGLARCEAGSFFIVCNICLAMMNLYPVSTLDGGGAMKCVLMMLLGEDKAEKASKAVSFVFVLALWLCAVYLQLVLNSNISLFFISVFLLIQICFS